MEKPKHKAKDSLMEAIGFTEEDLEANREGRLSEEQRKIFLNDRDYWNDIVILGTLLCIAVSIVTFLLLTYALHDFDPALPWLLMMWLICLGVIVYGRRRGRPYEIQLASNAIECLDGRVKVNFHEERFTITIEHMTWNIPAAMVTGFRNGDLYIIYYSPYSSRILSAEWLREE